MIIWLASYPTSGNTLLRSILISLIYSKNGEINFNQLPLIENFPSPIFFKDFETNLEDIKSLSKYWIRAQERINKKKKLKIFKTHNARCSIDGNLFTNRKNTIATIYIVRDPRDVLISASKYYSTSFLEQKKVMFDKNLNIVDIFNNTPIRSFVSSWSNHYNSWTKNNNNILLIRYEDLISDKKATILKLINFINGFKEMIISDEKIENCIKSSTFANMQEMEDKGLFTEQATNQNGEKLRFFNSGVMGGWQNKLDHKTLKDLEDIFSKEMLELGYIS